MRFEIFIFKLKTRFLQSTALKFETEALLEDGRGRQGMGRKKKPRLEDYEPGSMEYLKLENEILKRENSC